MYSENMNEKSHNNKFIKLNKIGSSTLNKTLIEINNYL